MARSQSTATAAATAPAPMETVADTVTLNTTVSAKVKVLEGKRKGLVKAYQDEEKFQVTGSPMYRPYFGNTMSIILNGVSVYVPLDGRPYKIPESFAAIFHQRLRKVDDHITLRKQLANVSENVEAYAGEKSLITRA